MSRVISRPQGNGRTHIVHEATGTAISTEAAPGSGAPTSTFSSTDLVAAALGSCISSSLEVLAGRHAIPLQSITVTVEKKISADPKRIGRLPVLIAVEAPPSDRLAAVFERAAHTCVVHRSLHPDIESPVEVVFTP